MRRKIEILFAFIKYNFQLDTAYAINNWSNVISTLFFTVSSLLFLDVIYSNINNFAGYSHNEMLVFYLFFQSVYYLHWFINMGSIYELIRDVNSGNFDLVLLKPISSFFYASIKKISLMPMLFQAFPTLSVVVYLINWSTININVLHIFCSLITVICGVIVLRTFNLIASLPVFWIGEADSIVDLSLSVSSNSSSLIPLEGYPKSLTVLLGTLIPILIPAAFSTSIFLGKGNILLLLTWAIIAAILSVVIGIRFWNYAINHYTSASS